MKPDANTWRIESNVKCVERPLQSAGTRARLSEIVKKKTADIHSPLTTRHVRWCALPELWCSPRGKSHRTLPFSIPPTLRAHTLRPHLFFSHSFLNLFSFGFLFSTLFSIFSDRMAQPGSKFMAQILACVDQHLYDIFFGPSRNKSDWPKSNWPKSSAPCACLWTRTSG